VSLLRDVAGCPVLGGDIVVIVRAEGNTYNGRTGTVTGIIGNTARIELEHTSPTHNRVLYVSNSYLRVIGSAERHAPWRTDG